MASRTLCTVVLLTIGAANASHALCLRSLSTPTTGCFSAVPRAATLTMCSSCPGFVIALLLLRGYLTCTYGWGSFEILFFREAKPSKEHFQEKRKEKQNRYLFHSKNPSHTTGSGIRLMAANTFLSIEEMCGTVTLNTEIVAVEQ